MVTLLRAAVMRRGHQVGQVQRGPVSVQQCGAQRPQTDSPSCSPYSLHSARKAPRKGKATKPQSKLPPRGLKAQGLARSLSRILLTFSCGLLSGIMLQVWPRQSLSYSFPTEKSTSDLARTTLTPLSRPFRRRHGSQALAKQINDRPNDKSSLTKGSTRGYMGRCSPMAH